MSDYRNLDRRALAEQVLATFGPICHLCKGSISKPMGYKTDPDTQYNPDPDSLSLDHLVPRSKGGTDEVGNLRPSHWRCNIARGNRPVYQIRRPVANPTLASPTLRALLAPTARPIPRRSAPGRAVF